MSEDDEETMEALGELYRSGKLNMELSTDPGEEARFSLTDEGVESAEALLRGNDGAVLEVVSLHLRGMERPGDVEAVSKRLIELAEWLRDDAGVNLWRVLRRNPEAAPNTDVMELPEEFVGVFDP